MTLDEAKAILGEHEVDENGLLSWGQLDYTVLLYLDPRGAHLDGYFTPDQLEAIATFMRLYKKAE